MFSINKKKLLLAETLLFLQEQQPAPPLPQQPSPAPATPAVQQQQQPIPTEQQQPAMPSQPATVEAIVDALNQIRAGSSFSEPEVYRKVSDFWDGLQETEKSGTLKALEGIAGLVTIDNTQQPLDQQNSPQQSPPGGNSTPPPTAKTGMPPTSNPAVNGAMNAPVGGQPVGM